jgi:hypothetical protein
VNTKKQSVFNKLKNVIKFPYSIIKFLALNLRKNTNDDFLNAGFISINTNINETYILLVNEIIKKENIALVQLDFFDTMPFALIIPEDIKKLFVCHELRYKRLELAAKPVRSRMHIKNLLLTECSSMKKTSCKRWIVS